MYTKYIPHPPLSAIIGKDVKRNQVFESWSSLTIGQQWEASWKEDIREAGVVQKTLLVILILH